MKVARSTIVLNLAKEVFGSNKKANIWLRRPNKALDGLSPIELLEIDYGAHLVETILGRIQHGIYS